MPNSILPKIKGRLSVFRQMDYVITLLAFFIAIAFTNIFTYEHVSLTIELSITCLIALGVYFILFRIFNQAKISKYNPLGVILWDTFILNTLAAFFLLLSDWIVQFDSVPALFITIFTLVNCCLLLAFKLVCFHILKVYYTDAFQTKRVLIIGNQRGLSLARYLNKQKQWGYRVVDFITQNPLSFKPLLNDIKLYPLGVNLKSILKYDIIDEVFCFDESITTTQIIELADFCNKLGIAFLLHSERPGLLMMYKTSKQLVDGWEFERLSEPMSSKFCQVTKTAFEVTTSFVILLSIAPILLLVSLFIALSSKGPIVFKQERVGLHGRKFYIYKFRTMVQNAEELKAQLLSSNESDGPVFKIKNDPRITPLGRFLRRTNLDELPQFFNILKGEMSLIGPRPPIPSEVKEYENWHLKRLSVKPGLTCTWQILPNRNDVKFEEWMQLDIQYINGWNFQSDIKLFFKTFLSVWFTRGY